MYLETERLTLRHMTRDDLPDWLEYAMDPESCRMRGTACYADAGEAQNAFEWLLLHEKRFYALVLRGENKCVGHLIVYNFPPISGLPELQGLTGRALSFCVSGAYRRRGLAREAVEATVRYLFEVRGVDYVNSGYFDFNEPSRNLHEKLGFVPLTREQITLPNGAPATAVETILYNNKYHKTSSPR